MEEKENIKSELEEIQTARDNIKAALQNEGETVTNDIRTYANAIPNVNKVKTVNGAEADTNKNVQIDASNINVDETAGTKQTVKEAIEGFDNNKISKNVFTGFKTLYDNRYSVEGVFTHVHANLAAAPRYNSHLNLDFYGVKPSTNEASYENLQITSYNKIVDYEGSAHGIIFEVDPSSDSKVNINVDAETADFDPQESGMTSTKIAPAIRELKGDISNIPTTEYTAGRGIAIDGNNAIENMIAPIFLDSSDANFSNDFSNILFNYTDEAGEKGTILVFYIDGYEFVINGNILNMTNVQYLSSSIYNSSYLLVNILDVAVGSGVQLEKVYLNPIESVLDVSGITSTNRYVELPYTSTNLDVYLNGEKLICNTESNTPNETAELKNNCSCYTYTNLGTTNLYFTSDYTIESTDKLVVRQYGVSENYVKG